MLLRRNELISAGVASGAKVLINAATPATCGVAGLVPVKPA